ncbi:dihydrolipoamide acetyltransferase [Streptococcus macacae]|uniref:Dihydrolipoamide acetyltransferase component of pyruvate dehydrogenase complex n=1 Tax=Streptococcus macacae NCTC 11558 TaxID=764298 RepID=G5JXV5_9STRE|nr:dihydrolipoamide acetyltransferase [Streptococcus macacae]EHJ51859.1 e3 binding domain protein [Streptococcus macacae NCTC 11558]SUN77662.1 branched-chain alpha-keto acid dehydrogenase E2 subunit [Streptococcus macacae NCTC 11558]
MAIEIIMPKLGVDMQEGEIIEWKKQEGDEVKEGDILLEIMSDKTNMEVEAEESGLLLKIVHGNGELVPVTEVIGYLGQAGESVETAAPKASLEAVSLNSNEMQEVSASAAQPSQGAVPVQDLEGKVRATPAARQAARDLKIELEQVSGTGARGRIHKEDVETYSRNNTVHLSPLAQKMARDLEIDTAAIKGTGFRGKVMKEDILAVLETERSAQNKDPENTPDQAKTSESPKGVEVIQMSAMRKAIAKGMVNSYFTAPTFTLNYDVDMTELIALRKKLMDPIMEKTGLKVTFTDLIGLAVVKTLMKPEHEYLNASLINDAKEIELHRFVNLGIAVGLDEGLIVPVVQRADKMSLSDFVAASKDVIKKAQSGKLKAAEMSGSTFSITNLGMFGTKTFNPIINQPNSAILGVAATVQTPVVIDGDIQIRPIMALCLTIDHRIVDGMNGAKFMLDLKKLLENPFELLI